MLVFIFMIFFFFGFKLCPSQVWILVPSLVRQELAMAWNMGVKLLQLELDSKVVLNWLTNTNLNCPTNILSLICDCRTLLEQEWEVHMQHVYREANGCADALAKRGTCHRNMMTMYNECPNFVYVSYMRDLTGLGETRLCNPSTVVGVVWNQLLNKTSRFSPKKNTSQVNVIFILNFFFFFKKCYIHQKLVQTEAKDCFVIHGWGYVFV